MRKSLVGVLVVSCLVSLSSVIPAGAGTVTPRAVVPPCVAMGLSATSLTPLFGSTVASKSSSGNICVVATNPETVSFEVHLYPVSAKASWTKSYASTFAHAKRLGGLGKGAEYVAFARGQGDELYLASGRHFAFIYVYQIPSTGELISVAHLIYRALA